MKILQVSHGFPPKGNAGVELYTFYLSQALSERGHQVRIFCREENPAKEEFSSYREEVNGLRVTRVVNNLTHISDSRIFYDNHFFDKVFLDTLNREKPDLIHFQHFIALSANLLKISKEEGYPVVLTLHDFFALCHRIHLLKEDYRLCPGPVYGLECASCLGSSLHPRDIRTKFLLKLKNRLPFPVIKWTKRFLIPTQYLGDRGYEVFHRYRYIYEILKRMDLLLVPSRFVQDVFLKYYPFIRPKMMVLPLGVPPIKRNGLPRTLTQAPEGKIRFCYFGNILPLKGLHILIDAFKGLPRGRGALTIYGSRKPWNDSYEYYDGLKERAAGFPVEFRGNYERENLGEVLRDQDVLVLPSICPETFSLAIREANAMGLPVIASRIGATLEAVEEGVNGFLLEPGSVEELRRCMLRFIEEPDLVRKMASHKPKTKWMNEHALELERIYQGILG